MTDFTGRGSFSAQVQGMIKKNKELMSDIVKEGVQEVVAEASKTRQMGGNMPAVTGFLRASGAASLTGMPSGPDRPNADASPGTYSPNEAQIQATIAGLKPGGTLFFGWTAVYARRMNFKYGFLDLAAQKWPQIIDGVIRRLRE